MKAYIAILTILLATSFIKSNAQSLNLPTEQWREDIAFLKKKLDITFSVLPAQCQAVEQSLANLENKLPEMDDVSIMAEMCRIVAAAGDGHTELDLTQWATGMSKLPIIFYFFDTDLYIIATPAEYKNTLGKKRFVLMVRQQPKFLNNSNHL